MNKGLSQREKLRRGISGKTEESTQNKKLSKVRSMLARGEFDQAEKVSQRVSAVIEDEEQPKDLETLNSQIPDAIKLFMEGLHTSFPFIKDFGDMEEELTLASSYDMAMDILSSYFKKVYKTLQSERNYAYNSKKDEIIEYLNNNPFHLSTPDNIQSIQLQNNGRDQLQEQLETTKYGLLLTDDFIKEINKVIKQYKKGYYDTKFESYTTQLEYIYNIPSIKKLKIGKTAHSCINLKKSLIHESRGLKLSQSIEEEISELLSVIFSGDKSLSEDAIEELSSYKVLIESTLSVLDGKKKQASINYIKLIDALIHEVATLNSKIKSAKAFLGDSYERSEIKEIVEHIYQSISQGKKESTKDNKSSSTKVCRNSIDKKREGRIVEKTSGGKLFIDEYLHLMRSLSIQGDKRPEAYIVYLEGQRNTLENIKEVQQSSIDEIEAQIGKVNGDIDVFYGYIVSVTIYIEELLGYQLDSNTHELINKFCLKTFSNTSDINNEVILNFIDHQLLRSVFPYFDEKGKSIEVIEDQLNEYRKNCERFLGKIYQGKIPEKSNHLHMVITELGDFFSQIKK